MTAILPKPPAFVNICACPLYFLFISSFISFISFFISLIDNYNRRHNQTVFLSLRPPYGRTQREKEDSRAKHRR
jgi:hypothetical protein